MATIGFAIASSMNPNSSMDEVSVDHLERAGLARDDARAFHWKLQQLLRAAPSDLEQKWSSVSKNLLLQSHPFAIHQLLYQANYRNWDTMELGPPVAWIPARAQAKLTNVGQVMEFYGRDFFGPLYSDPITNFRDFHQLSVDRPEVYWSIVLKELDVPFMKRPSCILDTSETAIDGEPCPGGKWLPGAVLNAAELCLRPSRCRKPANVAIVWRDEDEGDAPLKTLTLTQLHSEVCRVANALVSSGFSKGDAIAVNMPMTAQAVIIYLAIVLAGCVVVSIADSFSGSEIASRLNISRAKGIFTQDIIVRSGKTIPLYTRVLEAKAPRAIVIPGRSTKPSVPLRDMDVSWDTFLSCTDHLSRPERFDAVPQPIESYSNILFSSGTTGDPKAIPWTHATPLKAAADGWAHHDIRRGDVVAWPTNLGWMMGPWLVYASLANGGTIALYNGSPLGSGFTKFVQDARVTMLGVVPSIVRHWKKTGSVDGCNWSSIRCFSSTGEASNAEDMLWLMSRANYKPVIEYCGGTEIGGAFVTGCLLQPQALACFSTPAMGSEIFILDESGLPLRANMPSTGECALNAAMLGSSRILLNASHFKVYFQGMHQHSGKKLRRHGDELERMQRGFYKAHGRVDDTMNLGGIKVSSVEIERICNSADDTVLETAAIGVPPVGGGPERLFIVAVLKAESSPRTVEKLRLKFSSAVQRKLNPLFKVETVIVAPSLPRTSSNKVMRRLLRDQHGLKSRL